MKKILIISSFILVLIAISTVGYSLVSANVTVEEVKDLIVSQTNKEKYLTPYGYTLDNPNVILDPYGISPLTALILFETEEELPIKITVEGKEQNSTYTNTFEKSKRHYIPVYGLYPNTKNKVSIECGKQTKTITLQTSPLPKELLIANQINNDTNKLTFITSEQYPYALDNNNEVRWYLTKKYSGKINYLENNHLLLSDEKITYTNDYYGLVEIDLLGKIYKQYTLDTPYLGTYEETDTTIIIDSTKKIEIDKQTGDISNNKSKIKKTTPLLNQNQTLLPLYLNNKNYQIIPSQKYNLTKETKQSTKNIFLVGYIEPNTTYNNYNIEIIKTTDNLQISGNFTNEDEVYLILDKFLDKRVYDINSNYTIINKKGLSGKYSIYISINNTIYKTNNYIIF